LPWAARSLAYGLGLTHAGGGPTDYRTQYSNTPRSHNSVTADVETGPKLIKHRGETLCEDVGELRCRQNMKDTDLSDGNLLSDEMKINLHMLRALMLNGVGGEVHGADVVTVDKSAARWRSLELMQEQAQPGGLNHTIGDGTVLGFSAGARDDSLPLDRPKDQVVSEEHSIARRGATSVRAANPVDIGVDDQVRASWSSSGDPEGRGCAGRSVARHKRCRVV
jgi:hypothetical protein